MFLLIKEKSAEQLARRKKLDTLPPQSQITNKLNTQLSQPRTAVEFHEINANIVSDFLTMLDSLILLESLTFHGSSKLNNYDRARTLPSSRHFSLPESSGAPSIASGSSASTRPAFAASSFHGFIHSPPPQPYEPKSTTFLPEI